MNSELTVLAGHPLCTVQDLGRPGWRRYGVPAGGAADRRSLRVANALAGNPPGAAALECALGGPSLRLEETRVAAIAGADHSPLLDGSPLAIGPMGPEGRSFLWRAGAVLRFGAPRSGVFAYLAVAGGIASAELLGSRSASPRAGIGAALRAGDPVPLGPPPRGSRPGRALPAGALPPGSPPGVIRIVAGPDEDRFPERARAALYQTDFRVGRTSDRTGYRLEGARLESPGDPERRSVPMVPGAIQAPPGGEPIVLLADGPTIGGYLVPAVVVSADLGALAQTPPGGTVRLRPVSLDEARRLLAEEETALAALATALQAG
ncbi:MAG: biotin-dependent carboxyltransferase family protein [Planctomycetales bacterium]|nr:biotin-dependent carboxyltransferase family protein [Planctomycetales bacterium]